MNYRYRDLLNIIAYKEQELESAKESNRNRDNLMRSVNQLTEKIEEIDEYITLCKCIVNTAKDEEVKFKTSRIEYLEEMIEVNLGYLFPEAQYKTKLLSNVKRGKSKVKLLLKKATDSDFRNPINSNGGMAQQVISFTSSMVIINLLGKNKIFIDEALGNGSAESKKKMSKVIDLYAKRGNQIIMISQGSDLYSNIARREIHLVNINNVCSVLKTEDIEATAEDR